MLAFVALGSVRRWLTEYSAIGASRADTASSLSSSSSHPRSAFDAYAHRFGADSSSLLAADTAHHLQQHCHEHATVGASQPLADADAAAALFAASFAAPEVHALFDSGAAAVAAAAAALTKSAPPLPVEEGSASGNASGNAAGSATGGASASGSSQVDKQQKQHAAERGWSEWWCEELPRLERLARALPMLQARR